jgi:redox-sensitive bicupin YhaK (pirin superfamily)
MATGRGPGAIEVRRSADRFTTRTDWLTSRHSFSFGEHYDPTNVGHALLVAHNEDLVAPGSGYDDHPHRDLEIVTWVLDGSLVHRDSEGRTNVLGPGVVQRIGAGTGIVHSERNDDAGAPTHFVQMWVEPSEPGLAPDYSQSEVGEPVGEGLVTLASGLGDAAVPLRARAALHVARLSPGESLLLPDAPYLHVFLARGETELEGAGRLLPGDSVRCTDHGAGRLTVAEEGATSEVLVWEMHPG